MRAKKWMAALAVAASAITVTVPAYAESTGTTDMSAMSGMGSMDMGSVDMGSMDMGSMDMSGFSLTQDIGSLAQSNGMTGFGEGLDMDLDASSLLDTESADAYFKKTLGDGYGGIDTNLSSVQMPEGISFESLNTQYANLQIDFSNNKKELSTDVTIPSFNGYSGDSTKIFRESFGDLTDSLKIKSYSIPKSFDPNKMLSSMQSQKDSAYGSFKNSDTFKAVKGNLTYGAIFNMAADGVDYSTMNKKSEAFGLKDIGSLKKDMDSLFSGIDKQNEKAFNNSKQSINNKKKNYSGQYTNYENQDKWYKRDGFLGKFAGYFGF